jgi:signal transduction histidine kinase
VAEGKLDIPLEMDKGNIFGAFTESFDLMRDELAKARENERIANQSKKELVASLSHDIKTPVASIKAVSEIMIVKSVDEETKRQLEVINSKADQINTLITNMFTATLEELQELKVTVTEESSTVLYEMLKNTDYNSRVTVSSIPECIVLADKMRLLQVIDNIISNSYKYAGTSIGVSANIKGKCLEMEFKDYGSGVSQDEIPLLFNKFYRAKNSAGKSGSGLGLYISKYLMKKMSGDIDCRNTGEGFAVVIKLLIA